MPDDNGPKRVEPKQSKNNDSKPKSIDFGPIPVDKSFYTKHSDQAYQSESKRGFRCE